MKNELTKIQKGHHHDPFEILGIHPHGKKASIIREFLPQADVVEVDGYGKMSRLEGSDIFELKISDTTAMPDHYQLKWKDKADGKWHQSISPWSFLPIVQNFDLHLFAEGNHHHVYRFLGGHFCTIDNIEGCQFAVWAPGVKCVSVVGDFNAWDGRRHPMRVRGSSGVWELFIPGLKPGDSYKYEILTEDSQTLLKADPYSGEMALRPDTTSKIIAESDFQWNDSQWLEQRKHFDWQHQAISIYEVHAGSWKKHDDNTFYNWHELADTLLPYVKELGYTHIELMPIAEHPLDQSWGYQISGFYAPTARFGSADDFRYFIDQCHQQDIGIILDWVPAHFPKDAFALARFNGMPLYEHADPRKGEHKDWGTLIFDYGRHEVRNFLIANAVYWIEEFHIDGLRVDAVASMLYLDYSREEGEWIPNKLGGRENLEAIDFLREMNRIVHGLHPGVLTMAEESTSWPMVSRPVDLGGLGFSLKWNMGWMNDNLTYIEQDPVYRKYSHNQLTFSQIYAYTENFVLPLSHDEVVHGKRSMINKMPGDYWQKMANLRLFYAWQYANPGKKLLFMGSEFSQWEEWNELAQLDWALLDAPYHAGIKRTVTDLNHHYRNEPALHQLDFAHEGFQWIDCHDAEQSVVSLLRHSQQGQESIACIFNFTPVPRTNYRIGIPPAESYQEIINTDSNYYGGSNMGNAGSIPVEHVPWMGFETSISITLPPLAAIFLKKQGG